MEALENVFSAINGLVWGPPMLILILGVGLFLSLGLKLMPIFKLGAGFRLMWKGRSASGAESDGEIPPFQALMTALVGMATKYSEAVLAVRFREVDERGAYVGGPMYYIRNGLGKKWAWMGVMFAIFAAIAGFGIGNTVQANSVADVMEATFGLPHWISGVILMVLVGMVLIGGIRRIGQVASALVPIMAISYLLAGLVVLAINFAEIPAAFGLIFEHAFSPIAAEGGFAGAAVWAAIRFGVARGVFSNEAGLGSAPIAHAAAQTKNPINQGMIAMLGTFIDTIIICTITGLVIITSGAWTSGESGAALTSMAFSQALPGVGDYIVAIALAVFAFTTLLGWSFYGERCVEFLFGVKAIVPYRIAWVLAIPVGATVNLGLIWLIADTLNAMMALPNLIALALLSPVVFRLTKEHFDKEKAAGL